MARFLFVAPPFQGHLGPMLAIADALDALGHEAVFATEPDARERVERAGIRAVTIGAGRFAKGHLAAVERRMSRVRGLFGLGPVVRDMAEATDVLATELPQLLAAHGIDAVVCDQLEAAGGLVARAARMPYATVANALPIDRRDDWPPFFTPWPPARTEWERQRIKGAQDVADWMMAPLGRVIESHANRLGLAPARRPVDLLSPDLNIAQLATPLEYAEAPVGRLDVGPLRRGQPRPRSPRPSGKPLVYASLGTLFGGRADIFRAVLRACRRRDVELVIAHGGRLADDALGDVGTGVRVERWVDQAEMLATAAVCVTHAGMNTALDGARTGVPMLCIPIAFDQAGIAARVVAAGLGLAVPPGLFLERRIVTALDRLLTDAAFAKRADDAAKAFARTGGARQAAKEISERLSGPARAPASPVA